MKIKAYAKLNLTLDICGKREDGYHLLDSLMISVEPADILTVEKADGISVSCSDEEISGKENIACKAAEEFFKSTCVNGGADIFIEKHIPKAAGLGGGSADAAAVIRALDKIYETELSYDELCRIALKVGADVPFCINGGTARVGGIGESIEALPDINGLYLVIIKKGIKGSTAEMYRKIDTAEVKASYTTDAAVKAVLDNEPQKLIKSIGNHFAAVSDGNVSFLRERAPYGAAVSLSGSGPTAFAAFTDYTSAKALYEELSKENEQCFLTRPQSKGIVFE